MSKVILLSLLFYTASLSIKAQEKKGVKFQELAGWSATLAKAEAENKMIFVDAYTTWCGPCKMMDKNVYPDETVGNIVNKDFISIKIQMDSTAVDNSYVRSWYTDAKVLIKEAKVEAYPSFLFYSSNGKLIYKTIGYHSTNEFAKVVSFAADPARKDFRTQLLAYHNGAKDYSKMPDLVKTTRELLGDRKLALSIAKDYKEGYLEKLGSDQLFKRENLQFINDNGGPDLLTLNDHIFSTSYHDAARIDSILGKGTADFFVKAVITKDLLNPKLFANDKPITQTPNWKAIEGMITNKYPKVNIKDYLLDQKIGFYKKVENWDQYTLSKSEQLKKNPPKAEGLEIFFVLNMPAWDAFEHCNDIVALERALQWSNQSIFMEKDNGVKVQYLDTKANLLYKLGRSKEAIVTELEAIELSKKNGLDKGGKFAFQDEFLGNIEKMKSGIATWK